MRKELSERGEAHEGMDEVSGDKDLQPWNSDLHNLNKELSLLNWRTYP